MNKKRGRFELHNPEQIDDPRAIGLLPFDEEWNAECPRKNKAENIFIYGTNSWGQYLFVHFKWRPQYEKASVKLSFKDADDNIYELDEEDNVKIEMNDKKITELKVSGVALEILCPFRRIRLKVRAYLKCKNTNKLVFGRFRLFWCPLSNVFDMVNGHDMQFMGKEMNGSGNIMFEDRFEQFGQLKGTVQFESEPLKELYLWGNRSKHYLSTKNRIVNTTKIYGYDKKGFAFHIGTVDFGSSLSYRYGYLFWGQGLVYPITSITLSSSEFQNAGQTPLKFTIENNSQLRTFEIEIDTFKSDNTNCNGIIICDMKLNKHIGKAVVTRQIDYEKFNYLTQQSICMPNNEPCERLVIAFDNPKAKSVEISGGKGSSLAILSQYSKKLENGFTVPRGIVVTTNAYSQLLKEYPLMKIEIENLQTLAWSETREGLSDACDKLVKDLSGKELPLIIKNEIYNKLFSIFANELEYTYFAVRSSASGEDSEEMSAAGQMTTLLGVKSIEEIYISVMKCWASQFTFVAVEYKRGYGQLINSPMAVVIQEMVNCDSAGVMFTCDPFNGDERKIIITANYGLGESVVSAMADPDTVRLDVNIQKNSLIKQRTIIGIESIKIGSKLKSIKLNTENWCGGTEEVHLEENNNCCITDNEIVKLGETALEVHRYYGNARDIEWGIKNGEIYLLQSRPVTNLDNSFTEWEIMHELDTGHPSENEYYSRANLGEVFPGASTHMCLTWTLPVWNAIGFHQRGNFIATNIKDYSPYFNQGGGILCNQYFLLLKTGQFPFNGDGKSTFSKSIIMGLFGHEMDDPEFFEDSKEKATKIKMAFFKKMRLALCFLHYFLTPGKVLKRVRGKVLKEFDLIRGKTLNSAKDIFDLLGMRSNDMTDVFDAHARCTMSSMMYNVILLNTLSEAKDSKQDDVFADFAELLSSADEVVSAEVPNTLKDIAILIPNKGKFNALSDSDAIDYLMKGDDQCCVKFREFITKHGHRGYKEFDVYIKQWDENQLHLLKALKALGNNNNNPIAKDTPKKSIDDKIGSLKTPLPSSKKCLLKKMILPMTMKGVGLREQSKWLMTWIINKYRKLFWEMAMFMVKEGRLPETDLMFHLTFQELEVLINERNPIIVARAKQRQRFYLRKDRLKFNETSIGYDMKARNENDNFIVPNILSNDNIIKMKGIAVSSGKVKARVCVAMNLEEAQNIQSGDILITYSTDIGWSPYFPMLSGLATEIGGLISHGAVIAREYGLPCIIGVEGAAKLFKTGDIVLLDSDNGEIIKFNEI